MKGSSIAYLTREGFRNIWVNRLLSLATIVVLISCLIIVGSGTLLFLNINSVLDLIEDQNVVMVYIEDSATEAQTDSLKVSLLAMENIEDDIIFVSREEALKDFIADHDGDSAFSGVQASDLRHRFVVVLEDNRYMKDTDEAIKAIPGVAKTNAAYELAEGFATLENILHIASLAVIAVLLVVSLLIISNTVKLAMYDRKDEIAVFDVFFPEIYFMRYKCECLLLYSSIM